MVMIPKQWNKYPSNTEMSKSLYHALHTQKKRGKRREKHATASLTKVMTLPTMLCHRCDHEGLWKQLFSPPSWWCHWGAFPGNHTEIHTEVFKSSSFETFWIQKFPLRKWLSNWLEVTARRMDLTVSRRRATPLRHVGTASKVVLRVFIDKESCHNTLYWFKTCSWNNWYNYFININFGHIYK